MAGALEVARCGGFAEIVLHDATVLAGGEADDDIAETNVGVVTWYAAPNTYHEAEPQAGEGGAHLACVDGGVGDAHGWKACDDDVVFPDIAQCVSVFVRFGCSEGFVVLVKHAFGRGLLEGERTHPSYCIVSVL